MKKKNKASDALVLEDGNGECECARFEIDKKNEKMNMKIYKENEREKKEKKIGERRDYAHILKDQENMYIKIRRREDDTFLEIATENVCVLGTKHTKNYVITI